MSKLRVCAGYNSHGSKQESVNAVEEPPSSTCERRFLLLRTDPHPLRLGEPQRDGPDVPGGQSDAPLTGEGTKSTSRLLASRFLLASEF